MKMYACFNHRQVSNQQHIVQKLTVEIGLDSRDEAFGLQTKIANDYQRLVLRTMSEVFDKLVGEDEFLSIDKLEIDLGHIPINEMEYELPEKIKREVEEALVKFLHEARNAHDGNAEVHFVTDDGNTVTAHVNYKDRATSLFDSLVYYLEFGLLPWGSDKKEKPSFRFLVSEAMIHYAAELRTALFQFRDRPYVFRRLALQLKDDQLQYLAAIVGCGFSSTLTELLNKLRAFVETIVLQFSKNKEVVKPFSEQKLRTFFWQETLHFFSEHTNTDAASETDLGKRILKRLFSEMEIQVSRVKPVKGNAGDTFVKALKQLQQDVPAVSPPRRNKDVGEEEVKALKKLHQEEPVIPPSKIKEDLPDAPEADDGIYIANAGLVILAIYLPAFFRKIGLVEGKEFVSEEARWKAVHLLQWMVHGDHKPVQEKGNEQDEEKEINEHELILNKIFCGIAVAEPVPLEPELSASEKEEAELLLRAVIQNWKIISRISPDSLRITFLQKEGKLKREGTNWSLFIHRDSGVDIIIDRLPWTISMIKMPWNKETVFVEW
jgi:hypothetical protein